MNNRGWGLRSELWICAGMVFFFAIAVFLINNLYKKMDEEEVLPDNYEMVEDIHSNVSKENNTENKVKTNDLENNSTQNRDEEKEYKTSNYNNLEDKLVISATKYANKYLANTEFSDKVVTVVRLKTEGFLDSIKTDNIECSGYVKIINDDSLKYYPYIKCNNKYQSNDYEEALDNLDLQ